jgi:hypothetical protein
MSLISGHRRRRSGNLDQLQEAIVGTLGYVASRRDHARELLWVGPFQEHFRRTASRCGISQDRGEVERGRVGMGVVTQVLMLSPFSQFYLFLSTVYAVLAGGWGYLCVKHYKELL